MSDFKSLGLSEKTLKVLDEIGFETPSPIQEQAIPMLLGDNVDLIGLAQTGTGKTAAFGLPLIDKIDTSLNETQAVILSPVRELALQISDQIKLFTKHHRDLSYTTVYGGAPISTQIREVKRNPHIIVATPGRLIDLLERGIAKLSNIKFLVLDEADEMFNMGFKEEVDKILTHTNGTANTWLFTATLAPEIRKIINKYMTDPKEVKVSTGNKVNENIEHVYTIVNQRDKAECLKRFLAMDSSMRTIVFARTKLGSQDLAESLNKAGYRAEAIHGDLSQQLRERVMGRFKEHVTETLIATDVAARGIDVNSVTHVVHYDIPDDIAYYTHRSGRTARAGNKGVSLSFITPREKSRVDFFSRKLKIDFNFIKAPGIQEVKEKLITNWASKLAATEVSDSEDFNTLLESASTSFADLDKEALVKLLVFDKVANLKFTNTYDLNAKPRSGGDRDRGDRGGRGRDRDRGGRGRDRDRGGRGRDRDRGGRDRGESRGGDNGKFTKLYINLGKDDDIKKRDLLDIVTDLSPVRPKEVGDIRMLNKHTFFEVDTEIVNDVLKSFKNSNYKSKKLRVNIDHPRR